MADATAKVEITTAEGVSAHASYRRYGTFAGVFVPTLLTILGVIMFLRTGWVVGNAGILGGLTIISTAFLIVTCTGLAMSSITTNIRIGAGGAYSIISQSLGLEIGGSVGVPLYLAQALAVAMYIFGFREGWLWIFPEHPALVIDLCVFAVLFGIAFVSANLAFRVQYVILAIIACSLISVITAAWTGSMEFALTEARVWGDFPGEVEGGFSGTTFWIVFAVFFPAATGIMAGANMSGELKDPKRSIPLGTMAAIAVSFVIYVALAYWLLRTVPREELLSNYNAMIDYAYWGPIVVAGLLGATFSSGLASIVGAPRILQALGNHSILPGSRWLAARSTKGEPRNAIIITGLVVLSALLLRELNAIAPLITMFFLITYAMINAVVLIEQSLGLPSFRPLLRIPRMASVVGLLGCLSAMFIINPVFGGLALIVVLGIYILLVRRQLDAPFDDVRSGLFAALAEWAARKVNALPDARERAWKPNLLVPVVDPDTLRGTYHLIRHIAAPGGNVTLMGMGASHASGQELEYHMADTKNALEDHDIYATWTLLDDARFPDDLLKGMQALRRTFFRPNIIFLNLPDEAQREDAYCTVVREADAEQVGTVLHVRHPTVGLGKRHWINVWVHERGPEWKLKMDIGNLDLSLLTAYRIQQNWGGRLRVITTVTEEAEVPKAQAFLEQLLDLSRMPGAEVVARQAEFNAYVGQAPHADLSIFGMPVEPDLAFARRMVDETQSTCLFVRDSGRESALA
ncbi:MAG: Na-K-Cl cotransporter [Bacteroidetes bacterium]|jgi:amino acid transporter|nr:Na-K-Cl cotransporter [Bacteroidota bacterium]